jgi:DNA-binding Xre family transcriptional regulator
MRGDNSMSFSFKPLWKLLIDKDMTKKNLMNITGISKSTMDKMGRGEFVSLEILDRICERLNCNIEDIISYQQEEHNGIQIS